VFPELCLDDDDDDDDDDDEDDDDNKPFWSQGLWTPSSGM
jgi:hypothetical protein